MSSFDTVRFDCPKCTAKIDVQSKAGRRKLTLFDATRVPYEIAGDIFGAQVKCDSCGYEGVIKTLSVPTVWCKIVSRDHKAQLADEWDEVHRGIGDTCDHDDDEESGA